MSVLHPDERQVLRTGLNQLSIEELQRLVESDHPMTTDGAVYDPKTNAA